MFDRVLPTRRSHGAATPPRLRYVVSVAEHGNYIFAIYVLSRECHSPGGFSFLLNRRDDGYKNKKITEMIINGLQKNSPATAGQRHS